MKNIWKHMILLLGGVAFLAGCVKKEELNLAGYPETLVALSIADMEESSSIVTLEAVYNSVGELELSGLPTRTYIIRLASPSPEDMILNIQPLIVNIPAEKVSISETEFKILAGYTTASVTVTLEDDDFSFATLDYPEKTYELGITITDIKGYQIGVGDTESKVVINKDAYSANLSVADEEGRAVTFKRAFWDGAVINEDKISYTFKAYLDKPAKNDVTVSFTTLGLASEFAGDVTFTPATVVIPAGELVSPEITWTLTDDFLLTTNDHEEHTLTLQAVFETSDPMVHLAQKGADKITFNIIKQLQAIEQVLEVEPTWTMFTRTGWSATSNGGDGSAVLDGSLYSDIGASDLWVIIDMKEVKDMVGIATRYYAGSANYNPETVTISVSDNGTDWQSIGTLKPTKAGAHYFKIFGTISSRYLKVEMTKTSTIWLAEVEVYGAK